MQKRRRKKRKKENRKSQRENPTNDQQMHGTQASAQFYTEHIQLCALTLQQVITVLFL